MGGGARKRRQTGAETIGREAVGEEKQRAEELRGELNKRRDVLGTGLPETLESTRGSAQELYETGGFRPSEIEPVRAGYKEFATTGGFSPEDIGPIKSGYGEFATTGGFSPQEREQFLRSATSPISAIYARGKDELARQKALQGGYMPGYGASASRLNREAAQTAGEASLKANTELAQQVREGKIAGLGGLETTAQAIQRGKLAGVSGLGEVAGGIQRGRMQGQDALQKYSQFGVSALDQNDIIGLRNRLQSGQMSQFDAQLLSQLASQDKSLFDNIMTGIRTVGGATAGILTGVGSLGGGGGS